MNKATAKRKRHRAKQKLQGGIGAVRQHTKLGGRTGMVQAKRTPGKAAHYQRAWPNPDVTIAPLGAPVKEHRA